MIRRARVYLALAGIAPKLFLAYRLWVWMQFFVQILAMTIFVYFWRAVYASSGGPIGGLTLAQTLNYILLAQIFVTMVQNRLIFQMGWIVRDGQLAVELVRPLDFQGGFYVQSLADLGLDLLTKVPLVVLAVVAFGLRLPATPLPWLCFGVSLLLGHAILFCFDWLFACLAFYTTETWGLSVVREAVAGFMSGAFVPLALMPGWLQAVAAALPFAQALYVPVSFLSGITPPAAAPGVWLVQLAWLAVLGVAARLFFAVAVRQVTVQGG